MGGPEALTRNELIAVAARLSGHRIRRQALPRPVARFVLRATARFKPEVASILGLSLMMDLAPARWDDGPLRERGIAPTSSTGFVAGQCT